MNQVDDVAMWAIFFGVAMHASLSRDRNIPAVYKEIAQESAHYADEALVQIKLHCDKLDKKTGKH